MFRTGNLGLEGPGPPQLGRGNPRVEIIFREVGLPRPWPSLIQHQLWELLPYFIFLNGLCCQSSVAGTPHFPSVYASLAAPTLLHKKEARRAVKSPVASSCLAENRVLRGDSIRVRLGS